MTPGEVLLLGGLLIAMLLLIGVVLPAWLIDRPRWSELVEPAPVPQAEAAQLLAAAIEQIVAEQRPPVDPDGPAILAALARRAGIDGADS